MTDKRMARGDYTHAPAECSTGKIGYVTRAGAKRAKNRMAGKGVAALRPYSCPECGMWHIGHKPRETMAGEMSAAEFHARRSGGLDRRSVRHPVDPGQRQRTEDRHGPALSVTVKQPGGHGLTCEASDSDEELTGTSGP